MAKKEQKFVTVFCPNKKAYGLATLEVLNGRQMVTNFQWFDKIEAEDIVNDIDTLPEASGNLLPDEVSGKRRPMCTDKLRNCKIDSKGNLTFQCLYCSQLKVPTGAKLTPMTVFFLLDQSGSMADSDKRKAVEAVNSTLASFKGMPNVYYLVGWADTAKYYIRAAQSIDNATSSTRSYASTCENGYGTDAAMALRFIKAEAQRSRLPVLVFFITDGEFNEGSARAARDELVRSCSNLQIVAIGVGSASKSGLDSVATLKDLSQVTDISRMGKAMTDITEIIKKKGNINI